MVHFEEHIGAAASFHDVDPKQVIIIRFLDRKINTEQIDSDKKWIIITWNDYL